MMDDGVRISVHMKRLDTTGIQVITASWKCWPCISTFWIICLKFIILYIDIVSNIKKSAKVGQKNPITF